MAIIRKLCSGTLIGLTSCLVLIVNMASPVFAAGDGTTAGTLELIPTIECIGVTANFTGDDNQNNSAVLEYRQLPSGDWKTAPEMYIDRNNANEYRGSIFWLSDAP